MGWLIGLCLPLLWSLGVQAAEPGWDPNNAAVPVFNKGVLAFNQGDFEGAARHYQKAMDKDPACGMCRVALANCLWRLNRSEEAYQMLVDQRAATPQQTDVLPILAEAAFAAQRFEEARDAAMAAQKADPQEVTIMSLLLRTHLRLGTYDEAAQVLTDQAARYPAADMACLRTVLTAEQGDKDAAAVHWKQCQRSETEALVDNARGRYAVSTGDQELLADHRTALDMDNESFAAAQHFEAKEFAQALKIYDRLVKSEPENPWHRMNRANCHKQLGNIQKAVDDYETVFDSDTWVTVAKTGALTGILTKQDEGQYLEDAHRSMGYYIALLAQAGDTNRAQQMLTKARARFDDSAQLTAAEVELELARNDPGMAWRRTQTLLDLWPEEDWTRRTVDMMLNKHPAHMPPQFTKSLAVSGDSRNLFNLAVNAANTGAPAECLAHLEGATGEDVPELADRIHGLRYSCAVRAKDLPQADALKVKVGPDQLRFPDVFNHAIMVSEAGELERALNLLDQAAQLSDVKPKLVHSQGVNLATQLGNLDDALQRLHAAKDIEPTVQANLGVALSNAGRNDDARPIVQSACPQLTGENKAWCQDLLNSLD